MDLRNGHPRAAGLKLAPQAADAGADRRLGHRRAVWRCLRGAPRSAATRGSSPCGDRASARHGPLVCAAAAAPTAAPAARCAGVRGGGAPARGWTRPPRAAHVGYARTAPPSTTPLPSLGEVMFTRAYRLDRSGVVSPSSLSRASATDPGWLARRPAAAEPWRGASARYGSRERSMARMTSQRRRARQMTAAVCFFPSARLRS